MDYEYSLKRGLLNDNLLKDLFRSFIIASVALIGVIFLNITPSSIIGIFERWSISYGILPNINSVSGIDKIVEIIILSILIIILLIWIIYKIKKLKYFFYNGLETDAEIHDTIYTKKRQSFIYIYKIENKKYKFEKDLTDMEISLIYKKGDIIKILVDPKNHENSVLKSIYE
jgi:hypothetical protein